MEELDVCKRENGSECVLLERDASERGNVVEKFTPTGRVSGWEGPHHPFVSTGAANRHSVGEQVSEKRIITREFRVLSNWTSTVAAN
jgi:hypothetical protein